MTTLRIYSVWNKKLAHIFSYLILTLLSTICLANQSLITPSDVDISKSKEPTRYALLVGVSKYPSLAENFQLIGPRNDVILMQKVLLGKGFEPANIRILASDIKEADEPTKQAIMDALDDLAKKVQKHDFVYLHFGGHGSQQPANSDNDEADGIDEIFLPSDVGEWNDSIGQLERAITDNEIASALMAIRRKGAFVWIVFDSCHSGTMSRAVPAFEVRYRKLEAWQITKDKNKQNHIKEQLNKARRSNTIKSRGTHSPQYPLLREQTNDDHLGGYVAFFAAQTTEVTPEMSLPDEGNREDIHGLFSYAVANVLSAHPGISYRQAAQQILQHYATIPVNAPTPMFEGTHLDASMLSETLQKRVQQWPLQITDKILSISVGELSEIDKGSFFVLLKSPTEKTDNALGFFEVIESQPFNSILKAVTFNDKPSLDIKNIPDNAFVRLVDVKHNWLLKVALPPRMIKFSNTEDHAMSLIQTMKKSSNKGMNVQWVATGKTADLRLVLLNDQLWLLPPSGELINNGGMKSMAISLNNKSDQEITADLNSSLISIAKVINLLRLSKEMNNLDGESLKLEFFTTPFCRPDEIECMPVEQQIMQHQLAELFSKDQVRFVINNPSKMSVDVTLLFIDSRYGVHAYFPKMGVSNRIEAGGSKEWKTRINAKTVGIERMLVIAVQTERGKQNADFSFLAQPSLLKTKGNITAYTGGGKMLNALFREAGFGESRSRGVNGEVEKTKTSMKLLSWKVRP